MSIHYCGIGEVYIDAHGPDHGLMVASDGETVTIRDYSEFCEENAETGRWEGVYRDTRVDIRELFDPKGKHLEHVDLTDNVGHENRPRKADIIINAALAWIGYWGCSSDDTTIVDVEHDGGACSFFGEYDSDTDAGDLRCEACQEREAKSLRSAVCEYAYDPSVFFIVEKATGKSIAGPFGSMVGTCRERDKRFNDDDYSIDIIDGRWLNDCSHEDN